MAETRVLIMAGGTGGHVFPGLAVAEQLRAAGASLHWLGTRDGIEAELVPKASIPLSFLRIAGLRGKGLKAWLLLPWRLGGALWEALSVLRQHRPHVILGLGGFASGPGGLAAFLLRRPLVIHEQNAVAGTTNRYLARLARRRLEAFPHTLRRAEHVGNPVREAVAALPLPDQRLAGREGQPRLLVLGGSRGARQLNTLLPEALEHLSPAERPAVRHQCGAPYLAMTREVYRERGIEATVEPFIDDMAEAYGWADLVFCRAGALTVSELSAAGVAAYFVPFPYAIDDHQAKNARWLVDNGAAVMRRQSELNGATLANDFADLLGSRDKLLSMAQRGRRLAKADAARRAATVCLEVAHGS